MSARVQALGLVDEQVMTPHLRRWHDESACLQGPGGPGSAVQGWQLHRARARVSRRTQTEGAPFLTAAWAPRMAPGNVARASDWWAVQAFSRGQSAVVLGAAQRSGLPLHHDPELDVLAWRLTDDAALPQLGAVLAGTAGPDPDPFTLGMAAGGAAAAGVPGRVAVDRVRPQAAVVQAYEPGSHVVLRMAWPHGLGAAGPVWAKVFGDGRADRVDALARAWHFAAWHGDALMVPQPLGMSRRWRTVWQAQAMGQPLSSVLSGPDAGLWLGRLAQGLARMQRWPLWPEAGPGPQAAPALDAAGLIQRGLKQAAKLARADAALAPWLEPLSTALQRWRDHLLAHPNAHAARVLVHGDCHPDQLAVCGERLVVYDLDNLSIGSPAHDVADFGSQLLTDARWPAAKRQALARRWWRAAHAALGDALQPSDLAFHFQALLLRKAYSQFVRHLPGWSGRSARILRLATALYAVPAED